MPDSIEHLDDDALTPLQKLARLSNQTLGDTAIEAPRETERSWRGFVFQVGQLDLVFPFMGGFEILPERDIQPIPWAADWVRGITNVRGDIYSVVDFPAYLDQGAVTSVRKATLFLLPSRSVRAALLIEGRVTLRSFGEFLPRETVAAGTSRLSEMLSAIVIDGDRRWHVLDANRLSDSQEFLNIAA